MSKTEALALVFYTAFQSLKKNEKEMVVEKLLEDLKLREDMKDIISALERGKEKSIPYIKVHEELKTARKI
jgi:ABC-type uncharacterized transport system ATPase subunit